MREKEMESVTLKYSESFIKRAVRSYWWKTIGPIFPVVTSLLAAFVIYQVIDGDRSWFVGVLGATVIIAIAVMAASYFVHLSRSLSRLRRMKDPVAILELEEKKFRVVSDVGASEMQWSLIKEIWRFEHAWLLLFSGGEFMTLPTEGLSEQSREFITERAKANGAKIA
ncbi:MAG: YcxB family protein [Gammaproteobacteria bacterium]|nr:YcxB family protein [Gammaproteobacteria bacterium]